MIVEKLDIAIHLKNDEQSFNIFFASFLELITNFKNVNIIVNYSEDKGLETENILLLLPHALNHKNNGMSFVVVVQGADADKIPEDLITVPTLEEAIDVVEMENIERDLGL